MKLALRSLVFGAALSICAAGPSAAQYMKIISDNPADPTRLRASGTTILTITLDTNHDRDGSLQTCNSHSVANGCAQAIATGEPLDMFGYTVSLKAVGGTVTWGTFTAGDSAYTDILPQISNSTEIEINQFRPPETFTPAGLVTIGTLPVTVDSGSPGIQVLIGPGILDPFGFGTGFATECSGDYSRNTYVLGDPADPCGVGTGGSGDWFDADGVGSSASATTVSLSNVNNINMVGGTTADRAFSAFDPGGNPITFSFTGPGFVTVTPEPQAGNTRTGTIHFAPPVHTSGTFAATLSASANGATDTRIFTIGVVFYNQPPNLVLLNNIAVTEGATADQTLNATDPNGDPVTFALVGSTPTFATVTTVDPGHGTATGNLHLAPGPSDLGQHQVEVSASDGFESASRSLQVTVNDNQPPPPPTPPTIDPIGTLSVAEGDTLNFGVTARDPGGEMISFSFTGPAFATLTPSPLCGTEQHANLHLAPPVGAAGSYSASVSATGGTRTATQTFTIQVAAAQARSATYEANVYLTGDNQIIRLASRTLTWCAELEPAQSSFQVTDVVSSSLTAAYGDARIHAVETTTMKGSGKDGAPRLAGFFGRDDLRGVFAGLPNGKQTVDVLISGNLISGGSFKATVSVPVEKGTQASGRASPNPFNPSTAISFELSKPGRVRLRVYNVSGRLVNTLADQMMGAGYQEVRWDGTARSGSRVASGVYFYVLETPQGTVKQGLVLAR